MNMREEFEARFPPPVGVKWDEANQCYRCAVPHAYLALWMGWTAAQEELKGLLGTARMYIEDLADSLGNACEFFEGEDDEDPQAQGECGEAREFANRIRAALGQELRP